MTWSQVRVLPGAPRFTLTRCFATLWPMTNDVWALIETERLALADFLDSLDRDELMTRSLCGEWTVQEVGAHLAWAGTTSLGTLMSAMARDLFRANRTNARLAREWARRGPDAIVARLRDVEGSRHLTPGTRPGDVLADYLTHNLDIRIPLAKERPAPAEATGRALTSYTKMGFPLHLAFGGNPKATAKGLYLVATDVDWAHGDGPEVRATSSTLLRAMTGRPVRRDELAGAGADALYGRLAT
jgi:uncharacterized protein (TIGR03083 family)